MIALCLGGAPSVWSDLEAAEALLAGRPRLIVACNFAGIHYTGHLDAWVTLHPNMFWKWARERERAGRNTDYRAFAYTGHPTGPQEIVKERWKGSSGLYMAQIALSHLGATGAVLCGVPQDPEAGHYVTPGPWPGPGMHGDRYRSGFRAAATAIGHQVRSMGGWTAELFGHASDGDWLTERVKAQA